MKKVTIIDYGLSNLLSVQHAFAHFGAETLVTGKAEDVLAADALVLPGVGAFKDGMAGLEKLGLIGVLQLFHGCHGRCCIIHKYPPVNSNIKIISKYWDYFYIILMQILLLNNLKWTIT